MSARRVAVTGLGVVTPLGCTREQFWQSLAAGRSAVTRVHVECDREPGIGAAVTDSSFQAHLDPKSLRLMTPAVSFGVAAAEHAAIDAGLQVERLDPCRLGAFVGSRGHSSDRRDLLRALERASPDGTFRMDLFGSEGLPLVHPLWLLKGLANLVLYFVSLRFNAQGMNNNLSSGGASATVAIGEAFRAIQRGYLDIAFAGGYDSLLDIDRIESFAPSGLVTKATDPSGASRPFDRRRDGFVRGEGAGFLVLEHLETAVARGARVYCEVLGYGSAAASTPTNDLGPSAQGFAAALSAALADAGGVRPDAVFAFGLATQSSDAEETRALKSVFGSDAATIPVPAPKSMLGNTLAASGGIEAAAAVLSIVEASLPPTINLTERDAACDLDYVAGTEARPAPLRAVAINNANLAGAHAALVFSRRS